VNITTVEHRRALVAAARRRVAKILAGDTNLTGARILAEDALKDLDRVVEIDERAARSGPRPGGRTT